MKVTEHLKQAKDTLFSYEILPPLVVHEIFLSFSIRQRLKVYDITQSARINLKKVWSRPMTTKA